MIQGIIVEANVLHRVGATIDMMCHATIVAKMLKVLHLEYLIQ